MQLMTQSEFFSKVQRVEPEILRQVSRTLHLHLISLSFRRLVIDWNTVTQATVLIERHHSIAQPHVLRGLTIENIRMSRKASLVDKCLVPKYLRELHPTSNLKSLEAWSLQDYENAAKIEYLLTPKNR